MPDIPALTAYCDALCKQSSQLRHEAIARREQSATLRILLAERRKELARLREQTASLRRALAAGGIGGETTGDACP